MKILVLDGGGSKGLASARFLQQFEQTHGPVSAHFDLICGVSTGAILGTLLAYGVSATVACELYEEMLARVFPHPGWRFWRGLTTPKYHAEPLEHELLATWHDTTLGQLETDLMVLATQICPDIGPKVWKSWDPKDKGVLIRDVVRASSAAPSFFAPHTMGQEVYIDGSLCTNEPSMCCLAEAVRRTGLVAQHQILTIRCSQDTGYGKRDAERKTSPLHWLLDISDVMFRCSEAVAEYQAHQLIGFSSHVVELGMMGEIDETGPEFNKSCIEHARQAFETHRTALQNRFGG